MSKLTTNHFPLFTPGEIGKNRTVFSLSVDSAEGLSIGQLFKTSPLLRNEYKVTDIIPGPIDQIYCHRIDSAEGINPQEFTIGTELCPLSINVFNASDEYKSWKFFKPKP